MRCALWLAVLPAPLFLLLGARAADSAQLFSDDFAGPGLSADWVVDSGSFDVLGGALVEDSGVQYLETQIRYVGAETDTVEQFGKLRIALARTHSWGFIFRSGSGSPGLHYEVFPILGSSEWRWSLHDPFFVETTGSCLTGETFADGDWAGATVEGVGPDTVVSVWRWDTDPDAGGPVDIVSNWGAPDCQLTNDPSTFVDGGRTLGLRAFTGGSGAAGFADDWTGGDIEAAGAMCGDGQIEGAEECDDSGESPSCDGDCTFPVCGDGTLNPQAGEQCESDSDCLVGEACDLGCACIPAPVCGDGLVEGAEECDDLGESPTCDGDCTFPVCGDGTLNPQAGEQCESNGDCAAGEACSGCTCVVSNGQVFSDDFAGPGLSADWVVDSGSFDAEAGALVENSGLQYTEAQIRYVGAETDTGEQFGKLRIVLSRTHSWGFIFRSGSGSPSLHYEVSPIPGSSEWRWTLNDPFFVETVGACFGGAPLADGDWVGAAVEGAGGDTMVSVWRWDADPDAGGAPDVSNNWGAPDCQITDDPSIFVDGGRTLGLRAFTGSSSASAFADDWAGGDLVEPVPPPPITPGITRILGPAGTGSCCARVGAPWRAR